MKERNLTLADLLGNRGSPGVALMSGPDYDKVYSYKNYYFKKCSHNTLKIYHFIIPT
jgi:hypothetical protein